MVIFRILPLTRPYSLLFLKIKNRRDLDLNKIGIMQTVTLEGFLSWVLSITGQPDGWPVIPDYSTEVWD